MSYFQCKILQPQKKVEKILLFHSKTTASGKSCSIDFCRALFLTILVLEVDSVEDLFRNFNAHFLNRLFVFVDDIDKLSEKQCSKLKKKTTEKNFNYERKGADVIPMRSYHDFILSTNEKNCYFVDTQDRRLEMIHVLEENQTTDFWEQYYDELEDLEIMYSLFKYIENYKDAINVRSKDVRFDNESLERERYDRMRVTYKFLLDWSQEDKPLAQIRYIKEGSHYQVKLKDLYILFKDYIETTSSQRKRTLSNFSSDLEEVGLTVKRIRFNAEYNQGTVEVRSKAERCNCVKLSNELLKSIYDRLKVKLREGTEFRIIGE